MSDILKPDMERLHERVTTLPLVSPNAGVLNTEQILFVTRLLTTGNVVLHGHIVNQANRVTGDVIEHLPNIDETNLFVLDPDDLTAIIAKAAITGAAQAASDIGESLAFIDQ